MTTDSLNSIYAFLSSGSVNTLVWEAWTVPAGLLFLWFYGLSHFNSPPYSLELSAHDGTSVRLITQAPPKFTTTRSQYQRYALLYIIVLWISFIVMIFFYPTVADAITFAGLTAPNLSGPLEHRTLMALFILTGVLSSFPIVSTADSWLIEKLHKAAFIPDESRYLAGKLYESEFIPRDDVFSEVRDSLATRDTGRVANKLTKGELERRVIDMLCLRAQVNSRMETNKYKSIKLQLEKDFAELASRTKDLRANLVAYFRWQARLLPDEVEDIDQYIATHDSDPSISELSRRRQELKTRCDSIFELMCLLIAITICATNVKQDDVDEAVNKLGFRTRIPPLPTFDLDTVFSVTGLSSILWILFSGIYNFLGRITGISALTPALFPTRTQVLRFSLLLAIAFTIVMTLAIKLKRYWRANRDRVRRSEAIIIGISAYVTTVPLNMMISYVFNGNVTNALPYLFAINQGILGYFIARYIDFAANKPGVRVDIAIRQGVIQGIVAGIAASFAADTGALSVGFSAIQWGVVGFLVGMLFQHIYGKAVLSQRMGADIAPKLRNTSSITQEAV